MDALKAQADRLIEAMERRKKAQEILLEEIQTVNARETFLKLFDVLPEETLVTESPVSGSGHQGRRVWLRYGETWLCYDTSLPHPAFHLLYVCPVCGVTEGLASVIRDVQDFVYAQERTGMVHLHRVDDRGKEKREYLLAPLKDLPASVAAKQDKGWQEGKDEVVPIPMRSIYLTVMSGEFAGESMNLWDYVLAHNPTERPVKILIKIADHERGKIEEIGAIQPDLKE